VMGNTEREEKQRTLIEIWPMMGNTYREADIRMSSEVWPRDGQHKTEGKTKECSVKLGHVMGNTNQNENKRVFGGNLAT
jgi:hypothetical protein